VSDEDDADRPHTYPELARCAFKRPADNLDSEDLVGFNGFIGIHISKKTGPVSEANIIGTK
jgi:hypothetical protein